LNCAISLITNIKKIKGLEMNTALDWVSIEIGVDDSEIGKDTSPKGDLSLFFIIYRVKKK
jgi:hypothetical protein